MLALGGRVPVTETFSSSAEWIAPAGVTSLDIAAGFGARGRDAGTTINYNYKQVQTLYKHRRTGGNDAQVLGTSTGIPGFKPNDYCKAAVFTPNDPTYDYSQECFAYTDTTTTTPYPATTGASATGFGISFPGSTGNVAPEVTTFVNIAVVPGQKYSLVVPDGGQITIKYQK